MLTRDLMTADPIVIHPDAALGDALDLMVHNEIHELPVVEDEELVGIITDRDVKMVLGPGAASVDERQLDDTRMARRVGDVMTADVEAVYEDTPLSEACRLLVQLRVGALPVLDADQKLVGILSITDVLQEAAERFQQEE